MVEALMDTLVGGDLIGVVFWAKMSAPLTPVVGKRDQSKTRESTRS